MSDRIKWTTHKGHWVLRVDYSGLRGEEMMPIIARVPDFYKGRTKGTVLSLIDFREAYTTDEAVTALKTMVKTTTREYDKRVALIGVTGVKKVLLMTMNMLTGHTMKPFDSEQEGLDWLIS